jgi:hypothetical protein
MQVLQAIKVSCPIARNAKIGLFLWRHSAEWWEYAGPEFS